MKDCPHCGKSLDAKPLEKRPLCPLCQHEMKPYRAYAQQEYQCTALGCNNHSRYRADGTVI